MTNNTGAAILNRLIDPDRNDLSVEAAQSLIQLDFPQCDHARMEHLSAQAAAGAVSADERDELEEYLRIADFLAVIQSKARKSLARAQHRGS